MLKTTLVRLSGLASLFMVGVASAALDTTAAVTAVTGAVTDVETVAGAVIAAAAVLFGISKIRQVIKA